MKKKERLLVFEKYNGKCAYCGDELIKGWHVDHIKPIIRNSKYSHKKKMFTTDGTCKNEYNNNLENCNPSCASCNIQKNSFTLEQFRNNIQQFIIWSVKPIGLQLMGYKRPMRLN